MNPDFIVFVMTLVGVAAGFILGRAERKDSYVKGYKRGMEIGKRLGKQDASI